MTNPTPEGTPAPTQQERARKAELLHHAMTDAPEVWFELDDADREAWARTLDHYEELVADAFQRATAAPAPLTREPTLNVDEFIGAMLVGWHEAWKRLPFNDTSPRDYLEAAFKYTREQFEGRASEEGARADAPRPRTFEEWAATAEEMLPHRAESDPVLCGSYRLPTKPVQASHALRARGRERRWRVRCSPLRAP
jgi:hypothetical protein